MTVFVDTSAWYALLDADDDDAAAAARTIEQLRRVEQLVTHNYAVAESMAVMRRKLGKTQVARFVTDLVPIADVEWIQPSLHAMAEQAYLASESSASFVDHVSFALMRARGITRAFAFDDDFARQGFELVADRL